MTATTTRDFLAEFAARDAARLALPANDDEKWKTPRPTAEELSAALAELETETTRCGRCGWLCLNRNPGMPQYQMTAHAVRHRELEALDTDRLIFEYKMTMIIVSETTHHIAYAELKRRGVDTMQIKAPRWQTWA